MKRIFFILALLLLPVILFAGLSGSKAKNTIVTVYNTVPVIVQIPIPVTVYNTISIPTWSISGITLEDSGGTKVVITTNTYTFQVLSATTGKIILKLNP